MDTGACYFSGDDDDNRIRSNSSLSSNGINEIENAVVDADEGASNNNDDDEEEDDDENEDEDEDDSMIVTEDANNDDDADDEYKPNNRSKADNIHKEDPHRAIYDQLIEQFTRCKTEGEHINVRKTGVLKSFNKVLKGGSPKCTVTKEEKDYMKQLFVKYLCHIDKRKLVAKAAIECEKCKYKCAYTKVGANNEPEHSCKERSEKKTSKHMETFDSMVTKMRKRAERSKKKISKHIETIDTKKRKRADEEDEEENIEHRAALVSLSESKKRAVSSKNPPLSSKPTVTSQASASSTSKRTRNDITPPPSEVNDAPKKNDIAKRVSLSSSSSTTQPQVPPALNVTVQPLVTQSEPTGSIVTQSLTTSIPQLTSTTTISDPALAVKHVTDDLFSQLHGMLYPKLKGVLSNIGQNGTLQDVELKVTFNIKATSLDNY